MSSDPTRDPDETAARKEERVRFQARSNREIDADAPPPSRDESNANNSQRPPRTDSIANVEIPISTLPPLKSPPPPPPASSISVSEPDPDPTRATHSPQLDHGSLTISATTTSTAVAAANPSFSRPVSEQVVEESDDGFRTPTNTIPLTTECPPAPRKPKSRRRTASALLSQEEIESRRYVLAAEVDMWLEILEEEDRKRRMKIARREAGRL